MPAVLALVPAVVWRWLAIAGVALSLGVVGYVKGLHHQQDLDSVATAQQELARAAADANVAALLRPIATKFVQEHANEVVEQPAVASGIVSFITGRSVPQRMCPAAGTAVAPVPGLRTVPAATHAPGKLDAGGAATAQAADDQLARHIASDASLYRQCVTQLNALIESADAAGANKP